MDVLSQVKQNSAAREAAAYAAERQQVADRIALENAKRAEMARVMNQTPAQPQGLAALVGYSDGSLEDAYRARLGQQAQDNNYQRNLELMRNAKVSDGKIDPSYWDAAQKASDYELANGLAERGLR